jgi:two-component system, NarL family, sensor histidine kinase UhpB
MPGRHYLSRVGSASVWRDIAIALVLAIFTGWLAARVEFHETLFAWSRRWEAMQLDEWPVAVFAFAVSLVWLYALRHRQLRITLTENRRLSRQALAAQESERKRLARELHDELGQYLNAIQLDARNLQGDAAVRIQDNARHVYTVISDLVRQLRPAALDELGLVAALEACVDRVRAMHHQLVVNLFVQGNCEGLGEDINLAVYRIVQESLTNGLRHAHSVSIDIHLTCEVAPVALVRLEVTDRGVGLDMERSLAMGGGLAGIRERAQLLGGEFELLSTPGQGTKVRVVLPISGNFP